jgi:hypothetical protein
MNVLKQKNPLTESFLIQLDVDLESLGQQKESYKASYAYEKNNVSILISSYSNVVNNKSRRVYLRTGPVLAQTFPLEKTALFCPRGIRKMTVP